MKDQGSAFSGNCQVCSTPSPPVPNLCKQPVVLPTFLLCCHGLLTHGPEDQGAQPALCLCSLGCHWWEYTPSQGQWWGARVFLVPSQSWPLGLYDLLRTGSWDAISGLCNCCRSQIPGWHPQPSTHVLRKASLVPTARSPPRALSPPLLAPPQADPLTAHSEQHWALGSQNSPRGRCHTGTWPCWPLCLSRKDAKPCLQHLKTSPNMQRWILEATELYFHPNLSFQQDWWASCCSAGFRGYCTSCVWQRSPTPLLTVVLWFAYVAISLNPCFLLTSSRVSEMQAGCTKAQKMQAEVKQFSVV